MRKETKRRMKKERVEFGSVEQGGESKYLKRYIEGDRC